MAALTQAILQIVIFAVLARVLSPTDFGLVATAGIFIDLAAGIAVLGTTQSLVQREELTDLHIRAAFWLSVCTGLTTTAVLFAASDVLASALSSPNSGPLIAALSAVFTIRAVASVSEGLAARRWKFRVIALRQLAAYCIGYGFVGIGSAIMGAGAWALVYAQLSQAAVAAVLMIAVVHFDCRPTLNRGAYRDLLTFGSGVSFNRIVNSLANQIDRAIVAVNTNPAGVGLYTRTLQVARYPAMMVGQVIEDVLFPSFSGVQADRQRLTAAYLRSVGAIFVVMLPVAVFLSLIAVPVTNLLLGPQWNGAAALFVAFCINIPIRSAQRISNALLLSVGRSWLIGSLQVLLLALTAAGAVVGIRKGLVGAAIGVMVAFVLHYAALVAACKIALSIDGKALVGKHLSGIPLSILAVIGGALGNLFSNELSAIMTILLAVAICMLLVLLCVWTVPLFVLRADGVWLLLLLHSKLPMKWQSSLFARAVLGRVATQMVEMSRPVSADAEETQPSQKLL